MVELIREREAKAVKKIRTEKLITSKIRLLVARNKKVTRRDIAHILEAIQKSQNKKEGGS